MPTVTIPLLLRDLTGGLRRVEVPGETLGELITALEERFPGMAEKLRDGEKVRSGVAFTVDGRLALDGVKTRLDPGSQVGIVPSFGGG